MALRSRVLAAQRWLPRNTHRVFNIGMLAAAASSSSGAGFHWATAAGRDLRSWYMVIGHAYDLDSKAQYTIETALVIGPGAGASTAGFAWGLSRRLAEYR